MRSAFVLAMKSIVQLLKLLNTIKEQNHCDSPDRVKQTKLNLIQMYHIISSCIKISCLHASIKSFKFPIDGYRFYVSML